MKKILIIGGGAMGSAFTFPCIDNKNEVTITEPYNKTFIKNLSSKKKYHSSLKINLPNKLKYKKYSTDILKNKYDLVVVALSLSGINFISEEFKKSNIKSPILILTKGLKYEKKKQKIFTISEDIKKTNKNINVSVLKGPCLAKELSNKKQTSVIVANKNIKTAKKICNMITTKYYLTETSKDVIGVEICSSIKNIYSMIIGAGDSLNMSSSLFKKSINEMIYITKYFKGKIETALGLAGVGDLYVSAAGGRNSKMGSYLGQGYTFKNAKRKFMPNETVEGEQLAREIAPFVIKKIQQKKIPLMTKLIKSIINNKKLILN
ncbi:glycerol-3-phosphate dehydrogenase [Candidatus Pelagibacter sp.]|jgi:glycerol-3-phosphate dehydrogenase (NAD(P)+)|nr:glycerol-3-phosphate dehydrogenase [Candidatus Pelagibacter sp.]|tara:strand:+ start:295 stop:1254 length:960 start_codon:yes stop_codon:yes gene_type:complete